MAVPRERDAAAARSRRPPACSRPRSTHRRVTDRAPATMAASHRGARGRADTAQRSGGRTPSTLRRSERTRIERVERRASSRQSVTGRVGANRPVSWELLLRRRQRARGDPIPLVTAACASSLPVLTRLADARRPDRERRGRGRFSSRPSVARHIKATRVLFAGLESTHADRDFNTNIGDATMRPFLLRSTRTATSPQRSERTRPQIATHNTTVTDGPFTETKELLGSRARPKPRLPADR